MNLKIQSERLNGTGALQSTAAPTAGRRATYGASGEAHDSASISNLTAKVSEALSAEHARTESRVSQLAALYAKGEYRPDASSLSRAMVSHALSDKAGES